MTVPNGQTVISEGDKLILAAIVPEVIKGLSLSEIYVKKGSSYVDKPLFMIPTDDDTLVILVKRGDETLIPDGNTVLREGDILVMNTLDV